MTTMRVRCGNSRLMRVVVFAAVMSIAGSALSAVG
ncbi:MAG: hypothetical protein QOI08_2166, partial [Actinomycetota bacterium]|nr:hypothetical protein [Actinomycetota bacterium]